MDRFMVDHRQHCTVSNVFRAGERVDGGRARGTFRTGTSAGPPPPPVEQPGAGAPGRPACPASFPHPCGGASGAALLTTGAGGYPTGKPASRLISPNLSCVRARW